MKQPVGDIILMIYLLVLTSSNHHHRDLCLVRNKKNTLKKDSVKIFNEIISSQQLTFSSIKTDRSIRILKTKSKVWVSAIFCHSIIANADTVANQPTEEVVNYKLSTFFRNLCNSCMSMRSCSSHECTY